MSEPSIPGGYILVSRKILDSWIMNKPPEYLKVWIYLLTKAHHAEKNNLKRGQGFTSIPELIEMLSYRVGYRTIKPSKKKVWGIIEWLRNPCEGNYEGSAKEPMIVTMKVTHGFVYTILKYDTYQDPKNYEGNNKGNNEGTTKVTTKGDNKYKNYKNDKNDKKKIIRDYTQNPKLITAINDFMEMRTKIKKPMTERALELLLNKLSAMADTEEEKIALLEQSITNSWLSIYPLKHDNSKGGQQNGSKRRISRSDNRDWNSILGVN
jgi:hypothetical protein